MATSDDCATVHDLVASVQCRAQTISRYDLSSIPAYVALPSCAQSIVSYNILSRRICIAGAIQGAPGVTTTHAYATCLCSTNLPDVVSAIDNQIGSQCGTVPRDEGAWQEVAASWCQEAAGGWVSGNGATSGITVRDTGPGPLAPLPTATGFEPVASETGGSRTWLTTSIASSIVAPTIRTLSPAPTTDGGTPRKTASWLFAVSAALGAIGLLFLSGGLWYFLRARRRSRREMKEAVTAAKGKGKVILDTGGDEEEEEHGAGLGEKGKGAEVVMSGGREGRGGKGEGVAGSSVVPAGPDVIEYYQPNR